MRPGVFMPSRVMCAGGEIFSCHAGSDTEPNSSADHTAAVYLPAGVIPGKRDIVRCAAGDRDLTAAVDRVAFAGFKLLQDQSFLPGISRPGARYMCLQIFQGFNFDFLNL